MKKEIRLTVEKMLLEASGWCSFEKAMALVSAVETYKPSLCVEIGVYGGRSLLPTALAVKEFTGGMVIGIDPWDMTIAHQPELPEANKVNPTQPGWERLYDRVKELIIKNRLKEHCTLMRTTSALAVYQFKNESIDFLHIDGNHGTESVKRDVALYLPKMAPGGIIWFDDANFPTVKPAIELCMKTCYQVGQLGNNNIILRKTI